jgi:F-box associated protein
MPHHTAEYIHQNAQVLAGHIDTLQRRESQLRALLDAVTHEMHIVEARRSQLENDRIPFNWLPPELLIHVFVLATLDDTLHPIRSRLDSIPLTISHVCQRWRDIALSTPTLWRRIVLTPSDLSPRASVRPATQAFLDRSKGISTEVFCAVPPGEANNKMPLLLTPRSIFALRERESYQVGESYIFHAFPPLRSLLIHGPNDVIVDALAYLHNHEPGFPSLESLEFALVSATPKDLYNSLLLNDPESAHRNPWHTDRFPSLLTLTLRDIPLPGIALGQLPMLRDLTLALDSPLSGSLDFLRLSYFARLLACTPRLERLTLLRAGPVFSLPLDTSLPGLSRWEDDAAWRGDSSRALPPVLLEHLRELEWTDVHPETLHLLLLHFPSPRLEVLDIAFASPSKCEKLAALLHPTFAHGGSSAVVQPILKLSNLKILRADGSSGDVLRSPFLRLHFPALETLSLSNRKSSLHQAGPQRLAYDDLDQLPQLPRLESIFRDPRMPHLTHLLLSGFAISPEHASLMLGYMPCLQRLDCNFINNVASLLNALAATAPAAVMRLGSRSVGMRVCPHLRHIQLWFCDGVESATLARLIKLRNGFASKDDISISASSRDGTGEKRPIKPLPKAQSVEIKNEQELEKVEQVSMEGCRPITGEEAGTLRQWGVEVQWVAMSRPSYDHDI